MVKKQNKCEVGHKRVDGKCKRDIFYLGFTNGDKNTVKSLLNRVVLTISAWGVFWAVINIGGLRDQNHWILLVLSLIIGIITFRLGVTK